MNNNVILPVDDNHCVRTELGLLRTAISITCLHNEMPNYEMDPVGMLDLKK